MSPDKAEAVRRKGMDKTNNAGVMRAVCLSLRKGQKKVEVPRGNLTAGHGQEGDAHAGPWHRH